MSRPQPVPARRVCVLQPDYSASQVDYRNFDPPRDLAPLLPGCDVHHLFLNKLTTYRQLRAAAADRYDIFVNLCEGYLDWDIPSTDVIWSLEHLGLPYTGPGLRLYDPSKPLMKYVAHTRGVLFPAFVELRRAADWKLAVERLRFPLFVKPAHAGDSLGIDAGSRVANPDELRRQCARLAREFDRILVEEYIPGREFTVLVAAEPENRFAPRVLQPIEFVFPAGEAFKTYALKVATHHPECNLPVTDATLDAALRRAAADIFMGFEGEGYARLDFRLAADGQLYFLDINFACSVFYPSGYEGSADYILKLDPLGHAGFLRLIIAEGLARHRRREKVYERRGDAVSGFGVYAVRPIAAGEVVFPGEERPHRLVSLAFVERTWPAAQVEMLRRYALPAGPDRRILWDEDPDAWAPQNHSCAPNTAYLGLDVVALRPIAAGEELTLDYGDAYDATMIPFACHCGAPNCRHWITGHRQP